jgi:D-alanyl-D-alanine carboxypeptidase
MRPEMRVARRVLSGIVARLRAALAVAPFLLLAAPAFADYAALVVDGATGRVLYERNADVRRFPASLTKMMTLYLAFEALKDGRLALESKLAVSAHAAAQPPVKLGLAKGQTIRLKDAILAMVTRSANDVAAVVGEALGGTEAKFAKLMTEKARILGMRDTVFRNASGLPDEAQITTARDMVRLALALRRDFPEYYKVFATRGFTYKGVHYNNHNHLLETYRGVDGLKTGFTRAAGWNLAASARREGSRVVAVILGGESRAWRDRKMAELLDLGFERVTRQALDVPLPTGKPSRLAGLAPGAGTEEPATAEGDTEEPILLSAAAADQDSPIVVPSAWGIQVGAFASPESANRTLMFVESLLPPEFASAIAVVIEVGTYSTPLYRARFVGVSKEAAGRACAILSGRAQPCAVVYHRGDGSAALVLD